MKPSQARLRRWFRVYNRRYFGNRLPACTRVRRSDTGECYGDAMGGEKPFININPAPEWCGADMNLARLTLLHEMVHVEQWPYQGHGPRFQRRMQQLAAAGAMRGLL